MSVEVTKLPSGLTVITDTMPHLQTAALGVWAGVGGRDEKPNEHGISHLLEHMAFKGTKTRSSREIVEEIEAVGGDLNAGTSTETTAYYARVMKADVPLALDVLSDILANPSFVPDELEREKSVIVQEIGAAQDTPDDVVFEHLNELCYPDQPMGRSLLGTAKTLKGFNRDTLRGYLSTHYRGPDMVVAAAGAVDHKRVVDEVTRRFSSFEGTPAPKPQAAMFGKGGSRVVHRELEQAHLTLALEGVPQTDLSLFSLQVFTNTLGGGMSSRLFQEVREKRGLCYSIYTFHAPYSDTGFFGLYTGTDPGDAPEMMEVIVDVMNDAVETLTEAEVARAKAQMKAGLLTALESCSSRAEQMARHMLAYGRPLTVEELVTRIDAVSVESTRNAARGLLSRSRPAVVALGSGRGLDTAVAFARIEPRLPDAVGADLAVRRPDPRRLPAAAAPLCRGYRRRPVLSVPRVPRIRRRHDRRRHAGECPPRHRAGGDHRLLGRATPRPSRLHDGGAAGAAALAVRRTQSAPHRGRLHSQQCALDPGAGEMRFRPRGPGATLSLHQWRLAGPPAVRPVA